MPGLESDRPFVPIQPSAPIITQPFATPVSQDVLAGFRSGYITVEDLKRRALERASQQDALKTQIAEGDLRRREIGELGPGEIDLKRRQQGVASTELGIAETTAPARRAVAERQTQETLDYLDPNKRSDLIAQKTREALEESYVQQFGELPPVVDVQKPEKALPFEQWLHDVRLPEIYSRAAGDFKSGFPVNSKQDNEARAEFVTAEEARAKKNARTEYQQYVQDTENKSVPVARGTPEYYRYLSDALKTQGTKAAIQGAQLKALPGVLEAQAKGAADAPGKTQAAIESNRNHYLALPDIQSVRKVQGNVAKLTESLAGSPSPKKDIAAIFEFMKILDPTSTVREGEYATVENARSWPEQIRAKWNKATDGVKLTPEDRVDLKEAAYGAARGQIQGSAPSIRQYLRIESQLGAPPGSIVPPEDKEALDAIGGGPSALTVGVAPASYEELVGKQVTLKDGRTGTVTKNPDGTFSLKP